MYRYADRDNVTRYVRYIGNDNSNGNSNDNPRLVLLPTTNQSPTTKNTIQVSKHSLKSINRHTQHTPEYLEFLEFLETEIRQGNRYDVYINECWWKCRVVFVAPNRLVIQTDATEDFYKIDISDVKRLTVLAPLGAYTGKHTFAESPAASIYSPNKIINSPISRESMFFQ